MDEIRNAIYQATGVYVDGAAVADEIREAISSSGRKLAVNGSPGRTT